MKPQTQYIKDFNVDTSYLTKEETEVLQKLTEAAKLIEKIYVSQIESGFYPKDASKDEIEKAAAVDPDILSPYTIVERDEKGSLMAVPYHEKYRELLLPVAEKLTEAAQVPTFHVDFRRALLTQAKALLDGEYGKAQIAWLRIKPNIIDIVIGPIERVEDKLFFVKRSYQAWVGIMNRNITNRINGLKEIVFSARRQMKLTESVDLMNKAQFRADETIIFSGMIANYNYTATTLPNDIKLLEKYGSEGWIFLPSVRESFEFRHYPIFKKIFAPHFQASFTKEVLFRGYLTMVTMHEIARILVRYRFAVDRLREYYPIFNELTTETLAVKMVGNLLLKDVVSQKEMEATLVMFLTRIFDGYLEQGEEDKEGLDPLRMGNAISLNALIDSGALRITEEGISWPNFTKMYISVSDLADSVEDVLARGSYEVAQSYVDKRSSMSTFKQFSSALKTLPQS